jgi:amidase
VVSSLSGVAGAERASSRNMSGETNFIETTVGEIRSAILSERMTAQEVTEGYLERIDEYDEKTNSIRMVNADAVERAKSLDEKFAESGPVGPLHGVPIILKDNVDTEDLLTTAGSVLFEDSTPPDDAFITQQLRDAGGIVLAKANLGEFAGGSLSSLGGQVLNPYDLSREPGGSSAGPGASMAANLGAISVGSDTGGSVRFPASFNSLVGLRPTTGLVSRDGIIPLSETQDTAGPMTRTVTDTAIMLDTMAGYDSADSETSRTFGEIPEEGYTSYLDTNGLEDTRLGVIREFIESDPDESNPLGEPEAVAAVTENALSGLEEAGATVIDSGLSGLDELTNEGDVIVYEIERDINQYLDSLGDEAPVESFEEIVESGSVKGFISSFFEEAVEYDGEAIDENTDYLSALNTRRELQETLLTAMAEKDLDALVYPTTSRTPPKVGADRPTGGNTGAAPVAGFPAITVPAGYTADSELPVGLEFMAGQFEDQKLIELAYSFEQATMYRHPPEGFGPL